VHCSIGLQRSTTPGTHRLRLLVHQSQAGGVIGKSGSKIKELREVLDLLTCFMKHNKDIKCMKCLSSDEWHDKPVVFQL